ncbi:hypothetical protein NA655_04205 [Pseudomonas kuykendallii]|uniref:Uncharacterized protein n=1 Tax=Pseudomonas kuykendallii TaxID=1007099 RepID=A0A1H3DMV2_9PSED|nr:hypothetical protein [Pseudomonas kuykendallii]MCQ4270221.1 hypothetical protein [Pseudomonas kuykendallii]SDX67745.1 hypothetical protein SAMN05216287_3489 [Pseudomonas kuykendallii]
MSECRFCAGSGCQACSYTGQEAILHQIGMLLDFRAEGPAVSLDEAHHQAKLLSLADWHTPIGVWADPAGANELVEIWYQGRPYRG